MEEEELRTHDPHFWEDAKSAEVQMKKVRALKKWVELYNEVHTAAEELQLAFDYVKEGIVSEAEVDEAYSKALKLTEDLEFKNMLYNWKQRIHSSPDSLLQLLIGGRMSNRPITDN